MASVTVNPAWHADLRAAATVFLDERLGPDIAEDARRYAPLGPSWVNPDPALHRRTAPARVGGALKASIEHHMEGEELIVEAHAPYAAWVELGTSPHPIDAQGPWSLWTPVGDRYFGPHVNHPGSRPEPYLRPALYQERTY